MGIILLLLLVRLDLTQQWPSFRGPAAAGVADGQHLPDAWDGAKGTQIRWKTEIPGLAHSSPIVWRDRIFVTTAVSSRPNATFKPGLYGDGTASDDLSVHRWQVISLDRQSGKVLWTKTAFEGPPKEKRHIKSTYASSSPVTDGRIVVALFGSQGLYAYDFSGKLLWNKDLGAFQTQMDWGTASSPMLRSRIAYTSGSSALRTAWPSRLTTAATTLFTSASCSTVLMPRRPR